MPIHSVTHHPSTSTIDLPLFGKLSQGGPSHDSDSQHPRYAPCSHFRFLCGKWLTDDGLLSPPIHVLDDYSLLNIFSYSRPALLDESKADNNQLLNGGDWNRERWWYRLVQVCRRWRYLVLNSASHLRLSLVCKRGTPVTDMLAHSPPLPLIIDHFDEYDDITPEDEIGIILALRHRDRVRRIRLKKPFPILQKLIISLDGEFLNLEYLFIKHKGYLRSTDKHSMSLNLPETFRAPHLHRLFLRNFTISIGSPIFTNMENLVSLSLSLIPRSAYFHPNALLQRLSLMPQLEILGVTFNSYYPSGDVKRQLLRMPITTRVALPNLRWFAFQGASAYLEALLPCVSIPLLEKLQVYFFNQLTYFTPNLQQFMSTAGNLRLKTIKLSFREDYLCVAAYPHKEAKIRTLYMVLGGKQLDWQVASAAQVIHTLGTVLSAVEHLTLEYSRRTISSEWNNEADPTQWRELLGPFSNVKTLFVDDELVEQLSHALQPGGGESPTDLLSELQEVTYSESGKTGDAFTSFIDARRIAGRPIVLAGIENVSFGDLHELLCAAGAGSE